MKTRWVAALGALFLASAAFGAGKKEVTIGDLHPISAGSVEPAAPESPRLRRAQAQAEEPEAPVEEKAKVPAEPKVGFGRKLKPMRKTRLKPVDLLKNSEGQGRQPDSQSQAK